MTESKKEESYGREEREERMRERARHAGERGEKIEMVAWHKVKKKREMERREGDRA